MGLKKGWPQLLPKPGPTTTAPNGAIVLSDLSICQPSEALAWQNRHGCWRLVDYETDDGLKGVMLFARPEYGAPELSLPLPAVGPCRIFLGINYTKSEFGDQWTQTLWSSYGNLEVRLDGDFDYRRVAAELGLGLAAEEASPKVGKGKRAFRSIQDTYWRTADLNGQGLHFRTPIEPYDWPEVRGVSNLSYVRLEPLTAEEQAIWRQSSPRPETRRVAYLWCGGILSGAIDGTPPFHPTSLDWFKPEIAPALDNDVAIFSAELIRGHYACYRSRIGDVGTEDNHWPEEWVDPLAAFTQLGHENGIKVFCGMRFIGGVYPMITSPIGWARYFWQHQEWAKRDRDGLPTTNLSLAYPEVRAYWLSRLREVLDYGIDGITIYFHRFHPFVLYEAPVVEAFQAQYGEDPRQLPGDDPRWIVHCAGYVTQFLREVRALVDEKPGRELAVTLWGAPTRYDTNPDFDPIRYNCDVSIWIREGIVNYIFPTAKVSPELVRRWSQESQGRVHVWPDLIPRSQPAEGYARLARDFYAAGADGFGLVDCDRRGPHLSEWAVQRLLGHPELVDWLVEQSPSFYRRVGLRSLLGFNTRYSFNNFGGDK